jgi:Fur family zinc uptake transcriptional regulator
MRAKGAVTPPTVYRSLDKLIEKGLAHRLESLNAYVACKHPHHDHDMAAFAICESCGLAREFTDPHISDRLAHWSDDHAFRPKKMTVEIRGLCETCAK